MAGHRHKLLIMKAIEIISSEKINYNEIAKKGGLLNCTTWVMRK